MYNVEELGQVFTPKNIVIKMLSLVRNKNGRILEPSCGNGAFSDEIPDCLAIEIDKTKCPPYAKNMDFFSLQENEKFDTIIGNPPYVRFQDINKETKGLLNLDIFDKRTNLYMFFIYKCINHLKQNGELIFIVPRDFLKSTSCIKLNKYIYDNGTITDFLELGDSTIFKNYTPNCIIFRYEKGNFSRITNINKIFTYMNGQLIFTENKYTVSFKDIFFVKVGGVSGLDKIFTHPNGNLDFVYSKTKLKNETRKMFYNMNTEDLLPFKEELKKRKIRIFTEENWFEWGRKFYQSDEKRIYVNCKTRNKKPFFFHECKNYDGSMLAIFPKVKCDINELVDMLNKVNWEELGFVCDGRYLFSQKSLENCMLPSDFENLI